MAEHDEATGVTDETFDLLDWIESGTVARRQVTIYNDAALAERLRVLTERLAEAEKKVEQTGGDAPLDEVDEVAELTAQIEALYPEWEASKAVWTVRALSQDDVMATFDAVPEPKRPVPPLEKAGQKAQERFAEQVSAWRREVRDADRERRLHMVAIAVESVETARGTAEGVTVETLRKLRDRPHGEQWLTRLYEAVSEATEGDADVPRPTSPGRSTSIPG